MLNTMKILIPAISLVWASAPVAQDKPELPDAPPPPAVETQTEPAPIPPKKKPHDQNVPVISITTDEEGQIVEEYKINGVTFMMRVTPKKGLPYYLIDIDGDGDLETSQFPDHLGPQPVHWKVLEW